VKTEGLVEALQSEYSPLMGRTADQFLAEFTKANSALGRLPTAKEVANFCLLLASDRASAITGQCLNVDCGVFPQ
jgi:3-oxoacyl-[acyl-carrier protein] reductase/meso-butanediol dehydrogenase/(S,S)-butanediol dehydrogenase/diacetyl reductase